ncbi:MAG: hypothetical protein FE047_01575 [Thermoplasmata archaeon]|nr:MAG: hypothetical protein FE047_01575 [Thermoplasmata archaeon]KAA0014082.1 MAG: hypothetical protein FE041_02000 [Thermoplasmata archaeon]OYT61511.1 MAG: hypothetical protein B6U81_02825 [Thermoplasmatales archaeon ex4484_30]
MARGGYKKVVILLIFLLSVTMMQYNASGIDTKNNKEKFYRVFVHSIGPMGEGGVDGLHAVIPGFGIDFEINFLCEKGWYRDSCVIVRNFSGEIVYKYTGRYWLNITHFTGWMFPSGILLMFIPPVEAFPVPIRIFGICEKLEITPLN